MRTRIPLTSFRFAVLSGALALSAIARADDRVLLYEKKPAPPNVMLIMSNATTMANIPATSILDPLGGVDGLNSKMGIGKYAITSVVRSLATSCANGQGGCINWGLSSFSYDRADLKGGTKHYIFQTSSDLFNGRSFAIPAGTKFNFGQATYATQSLGTGSNKTTYAVVSATNGSTNWITTITDPSSTVRSYFVASSPTSVADTAHLPLLGGDASTVVIVTNVPSSASPTGDSKREAVFKFKDVNNGGSIHPYSLNRTSGNSFRVDINLYDCASTAPCDPSTATGVGGGNDTATFVVPPEYCAENVSTCSFPLIYGYGSDAGREIGWVSPPKQQSVTNNILDWSGNNSSGNASGWLQHPATNPQPVVLIPHDYTPWLPYQSATAKPSAAQQNYVQNPNPCILRALRPTASVLHIGTSTNTTYTQSDDYPVWNVTTDTAGGQTSACDLESDGFYQTGAHIIGNPDSGTNTYKNNSNNRMIAPIFPTGNGNVAPLQGVMNDVFRYFNGANQPNLTGTGCSTNSMVDNFCGAKRIDDPRKNCRNDAVILITDSYQAQSAVTQADVSPLAQINVPVYVVGFGIASGDLGPTNVCQVPDGVGGTTGGNRGQCIALWSGATIVSSDGVTIIRQGYYTASNTSDLIAALTSVANLLNEETRDFATATIPSVSATSEGIAYLSEFNPQNEHSIWSGHLRAFALDPVSGLVQTTGAGFPLLTKYVFGTGTTAPTGSLIWDAGNTGQDTRPTTNDIGVVGLLDKNTYIDFTSNPTPVLAAGAGWSDSTHDQAAGKFGRNLFFGMKPLQKDASNATLCGSSTYECLVQLPVGVIGGPKTGTNCPSPLTSCQNFPPTPPSSLPAWWATIRDNSDPATQTIYANIPNPIVYPNGMTPRGTELSAGAANSDPARNQTLQNAFSFMRGNRDVVVEDLHISTQFGSPTQNRTCTQLNGVSSSPCYYDQILGDIFHSNPVIVSFPNNTRLYLSNDPGSANPGVYSDRNNSYQTFYANYRHRRKILYAGADDGFLHAFDAGVFNGDRSTYTANGSTICNTCDEYDLGSGREIFGYAPRAALQKFFFLSHATTHDWTLDGAPSVDDVYIDVARTNGTPQGVNSSDACGSPCADISGTTPKWRTVLVGGEREGGINTTPNGGGGSVFALDITDPDQSANMTKAFTGTGTGETPTRGSPQCLVTSFDASSSTNPSGCAAPFPRILWEFRDDQAISTANPPVPAETAPESTVWDLGYTWSKPVIGRVKVKDATTGTNRDFFVAIFGGGFRHSGTSIASNATSGDSANYLYMLDIETGKVIYKRNIGVWSTGAHTTDSSGNLEAGVPGEAAVVDVNFDGYLDRIYFGDTQGRMWKIDLSALPDFCSSGGSNCPAADSRVSPSQWNPSLLFDEFQDVTPAAGAGVRQPIFTRPSVFLLGTTGSGAPRLGIAFGTGDRDNMPILRDANHNYFYVVLDDPSVTYPVFMTASSGSTASTLTQASFTANNCTSANACFNGTGVGYYLPLAVDTIVNGSTTYNIAEIVNSNPLVFSKSIFFNTFLNNTILLDDGTQVGKGTCGEVGKAFLHQVDYLTGESQYLVNGSPVESISPDGAQVASDTIVYQAPNGETIVVSATDDLKVPKVGGGSTPAVNIKSWKEN